MCFSGINIKKTQLKFKLNKKKSTNLFYIYN